MLRWLDICLRGEHNIMSLGGGNTQDSAWPGGVSNKVFDQSLSVCYSVFPCICLSFTINRKKELHYSFVCVLVIRDVYRQNYKGVKKE